MYHRLLCAKAAIVVLLICVVFCLDGLAGESDTAKSNSFEDKYFKIESGPPKRPKRPQKPSAPDSARSGSVEEATAPEFVPGSTESIRILRVRDTEKIEAILSRRFSLLGVNAFPKFSVHPRIRNYGGIACPLVRALLEDETVVVEYDKESKSENGYVPVYVFLPDGRMVNKLLVENGLAFLEKRYEDLKYGEDLYKALQKAKRQRLGYWSQSGKNKGAK